MGEPTAAHRALAKIIVHDTCGQACARMTDGGRRFLIAVIAQAFADDAARVWREAIGVVCARCAEGETAYRNADDLYIHPQSGSCPATHLRARAAAPPA
jgi:hypothetical protein